MMALSLRQRMRLNQKRQPNEHNDRANGQTYVAGRESVQLKPVHDLDTAVVEGFSATSADLADDFVRSRTQFVLG